MVECKIVLCVNDPLNSNFFCRWRWRGGGRGWGGHRCGRPGRADSLGRSGLTGPVVRNPTTPPAPTNPEHTQTRHIILTSQSAHANMNIDPTFFLQPLHNNKDTYSCKTDYFTSEFQMLVLFFFSFFCYGFRSVSTWLNINVDDLRNPSKICGVVYCLGSVHVVSLQLAQQWYLSYEWYGPLLWISYL